MNQNIPIQFIHVDPPYFEDSDLEISDSEEQDFEIDLLDNHIHEQRYKALIQAAYNRQSQTGTINAEPDSSFGKIERYHHPDQRLENGFRIPRTLNFDLD